MAYGWEPTETHTTDPDTGVVTVTRESEWDDYERDKMLGLEIYEADLCSGCGVHKSRMVAGEHFYTYAAESCVVCAGADMFHRTLQAADHEFEKRIPEGMKASMKAAKARPSDGRMAYIREQTAEQAAARPAG